MGLGGRAAQYTRARGQRSLIRYLCRGECRGSVEEWRPLGERAGMDTGRPGECRPVGRTRSDHTPYREPDPLPTGWRSSGGAEWRGSRWVGRGASGGEESGNCQRRRCVGCGCRGWLSEARDCSLLLDQLGGGGGGGRGEGGGVTLGVWSGGT